jgi:hypothetical protein
MGRKRSDYICPRCGQPGFKRTNPDAVVHYDSKTGKRRTCYYQDELKRKLAGIPEAKAKDIEVKVKEYQGESPLYHKLGSIAGRLEKIADSIRKSQMRAFQIKPNDKTASKCVEYLDIFEDRLLDPLERLLKQDWDKRYRMSWDSWFKTLLDSLEHGPRDASRMNAILTGRHIFKLGKELNTVHEIAVENIIDPRVIGPKKAKQILTMARDVLKMNAYENAINEWNDNTEINMQIQTADEFYKRETAKRQRKRKVITK